MGKTDDALIDPEIFRAYDIRGVVETHLTPLVVNLIGKAIGSEVLQHGERQVVIARDGRLSGPILSQALCAGLLATGCDVIDLGMVPTPLLYYATSSIEGHSGVMLTGSHNPSHYNGLKIVIKGSTLTEEGIQKLYQRAVMKDFTPGTGVLFELDMIPRYLNHVCRNVKLGRALKVVVDAGNGIAGLIAPRLYRDLGCQVIELYCTVDGNFPNHHPDPSQEVNLSTLIQTVREHKADVGLAFDGDGDRLGVVNAAGEIIWPDRVLMLFAQDVLGHYPGSTIIYDVKCSDHLDKLIRSAGGEPLMWKTGHSLIKAKLAETKARLAGEMSGHFFFNDRWYGFDDALYAGARLLEILSHREQDSASVFASIPNSVNTPELKVSIDEKEKFALMQRLSAEVHRVGSAEINTIDGLRISFADGWGLVRPSNTTPYLILRFEALNKTILSNIQKLFREWMLSVKSDLIIPF